MLSNHEIELEKTYLIKTLPDLTGLEFNELLDIYVPVSDAHPTLRLRKRGEKCEITKKAPVSGTDSSQQLEQTIPLTAAEFAELATVPGKRLRKLRYYYDYNGRMAEIDVFQDDLAGLAVADFEFKTIEEMNNFTMPDFCLVDVTQEKFIAGGMLCGKKYSDIEADLQKLGYSKITTL